MFNCARRREKEKIHFKTQQKQQKQEANKEEEKGGGREEAYGMDARIERTVAVVRSLCISAMRRGDSLCGAGCKSPSVGGEKNKKENKRRKGRKKASLPS